MTGNELIDNLEGITIDNISIVEKKIRPLSEDQQNWKPNPSTWSLNEIFAHLNSYARFYHQAFETAIDSTKFKSPTKNFLSSPLGKAAWNSMKLGRAKNVKRKFKSPRSYNPSFSSEILVGKDWKDFIQHQNKLLDLFSKAKLVNIKRTKIPLSISKIIKFRLGDAFNFVVYHNERHVQQALNLLNHRHFPKK
jgi:DinB superfamily